MRRDRILCAFAAIVLVASLAGCGGNSWSFDFKKEADLAAFPKVMICSPFRWDRSILGIELDGYAFFGPYYYMGDLTMTVKFNLLTDSVNTADVKLGLFSEPSPLPEDFVGVYCQKLGNDGAVEIYMAEGADMDIRLIAGNQPGYNKSGANTIKIVRKGNNYSATLNGALIARFDANYCSPGQLYPWMFSSSEGGKVYITSIKVDY